MLKGLGVDEAEQWLLPELENWDSEPHDQSDIWKSLHNRADCWLELWISKYKVTKMVHFSLLHFKWTEQVSENQEAVPL